MICFLNSNDKYTFTTKPLSAPSGMAYFISTNSDNRGIETRANPNPEKPCVNAARKSIILLRI